MLKVIKRFLYLVIKKLLLFLKRVVLFKYYMRKCRWGWGVSGENLEAVNVDGFV